MEDEHPLIFNFLPFDGDQSDCFLGDNVLADISWTLMQKQEEVKTVFESRLHKLPF